MRVALILPLVACSGCVRSLEDVSSLPLTEAVASPRPADEIRDCLVTAMSKINVTPTERGPPERRSVSFTGPYGVIAEYVLTPTAQGTGIEIRRRKMIADGYSAARACYAAE